MNTNVMTRNALQNAFRHFEMLNDWAKYLAIVFGGIFVALADWIFGSVTLTVLFSQYQAGGKIGPFLAPLVGFTISMGLWGVQVVLWQLLLSGRYGHFKTWPQKLLLGAVVLLMIGDDFLDCMAVWWMLRNNPIQPVMDHGLYTFLMVVVFGVIGILVGFSEFFMSVSIALAKEETKTSFQPRSSYSSSHPQSQPNNVQRGRGEQTQTRFHIDPSIESRLPRSE